MDSGIMIIGLCELLIIVSFLFDIPETLFENLQSGLFPLSESKIQKAVEKGNYIYLDKQIKKVKKNLPAPKDDSFVRDDSSSERSKRIYIDRLLNSNQYMHFTNLLGPLTENYKEMVEKSANPSFYKGTYLCELYEEKPELLEYERFLYENLCRDVFLYQASANMNLSERDFVHEYDRYLFVYFYFIIHMLAQDKTLPDGNIVILDFCMNSYVACIKLQRQSNTETSFVTYPIEWPTEEEAKAFMKCYKDKYSDFYEKHLLKYESEIQTEGMW